MTSPDSVAPTARAYPVIRLLVGVAAAMIIIAGLKQAAALLLPFAFAVILSIVVLPVVNALVDRKVPRWLAIAFVVVMIAGVLFAFWSLVVTIAADFTASLPEYRSKLTVVTLGALDTLDRWGLHIGRGAVEDIINPGAAMNLVGKTLNSLSALLSNTVLVLITVIFILLEARDVRDKIVVAFNLDDARRSQIGHAAFSVQRYLFLKTLICLATGLLIGVGTWAIGLDFPMLWGLLGFLLNYIPTIGSIIASIPAILVALIQLGPGYAIVVAAGYLAVNTSIGNFFEPRFMGRSLGISPLVVFLSLIFWGWLWGPAGMLLSVPLTASVKILLENQEETRAAAVLLGPARPP
ncbi:AI-2E family transporter, partial [bacterium]|nr:AI-2E family transporter [bacterium]